MEPSEKYVFAQKKPMYDTIPLIIFEKVEKKYPKVDVEDLKYYVPSTFWMKFRILLFWILWAMLIIAMMICILTYFCFTPFVIPQVCYANIQEDKLIGIKN
ncbi:hypothetical protein DMN91_006878 [Ooceraea biroi]|uniref:Uncharacterized protein n=1 Tax=Ooceraea biroi TaxID=2015173 RepID=A0A3L8DIT9_OOCBI|nr:hypothetical protein DMN91_006878 [Ooceraea biroi]